MSSTSWNTTTSNGDWGTSANWTNGIPTSTTDVIFDISAQNVLIAQSEQYAKSITFTNNILNSFAIHGDTQASGVPINKLTVSEYITNSGNKNIYIGAEDQKVQINFHNTSTNPTLTTSYTITNQGTGTIEFYDPILVNATSSNVLDIYGSIVLNKGIIMTSQSTLNINDFLYLYGQVSLGSINLNTDATLHIGYDVLFTDIPNMTGTGRFYVDIDNTFDLNLIPGQTIGTGKLTVDGGYGTTLTLGSNSTISMNIVDDNTYDEIGMEGSVVLDGSLNLNFLGAIGLEMSMVLFPDRTTFGGTFSSVNASGHYGNLTFTKNNHIWSSTSTSSSTYFTFDEHTGTLNQIELIPSIVQLTGPSSVTQGVVNQYTATVQYEVSDFPVIIPQDYATQMYISAPVDDYITIRIKSETYWNLNELLLSLEINNDNFNTFTQSQGLTNDNISIINNTLVLTLFTIYEGLINEQIFIEKLLLYLKLDIQPQATLPSTYTSSPFQTSTVLDATGNVDLYIDGAFNQTKVLYASGSATFDVSLNTLPFTELKAVYPAQGILDASESQILNVTVIGILTPFLSTIPTKIYDGTDNISDPLTIELSGINSSFPNVSATYTTATYNDKNVAVNKTITISGITLNGFDLSNYQLYTSSITTTGTIIRKDVSANFMVQDKIYDGTVEAIIVDTPTIHGKIESDSLSLILSKAEFLDANVGTDKLVVATLPYELSGDDSQNYTLISHPTSTADINARDVSGSFIVYEKEYDGTVEVQVSGAPIVNGKVFDDDVSLVIRSAESVSANVGSNIQVVVSAYDLSGGTANNYRIETPITSYVNIVPRDVSGSFIVYEKEYDGTVEVQVSGAPIVNRKVFDDDVFLIISDAEFDDENVGVGKSVTATAYDLSGGTANNYRIISAPVTTGVIYTRDVSGSFTVLDKVYDGTTGATISSMSLTRVLPSDDVGLTGSAFFLTPNIGTNKEVRLFNSILFGDDSNNYNLESILPTYATIFDIQGSMVLESVHVSYVYGDSIQLRTTINQTLEQTGTVDYYQIIDSQETLVRSSIPVDNYIALIDISGFTIGDYEFKSKYNLSNGIIYSSDIITIQVNKRNITVSCHVADKNYDGTTTATLVSNNGILNSVVGDNVDIEITSVAFENSSAGVNKAIDATYVLTGSNLNSYELTLPITRATIRQLDISGAFTAYSKMYDSTTPTRYSSSSVVFTGILPGDVGSVSLVNGVANFENVNVGTNKRVILTGQLTGQKGLNYNFIGAYGSATISVAELVSDVTVLNKIYDGTSNATISSISSKIRTANGTLVDIPQVDVSNIGYNFVSRFEDDNIGVNKSIIMSGRVSNRNYFAGTIRSSKANISKKDIQGIVRSTREYNGSDTVSELTKELIGVISKDMNNVSFDVSNVRHSTQNVGINPLNIGSYEIAGSRAFNYNLTVNGIGTITERPLIAEFPYSTKIYDGNTSMILTSPPTFIRGTAYGQVYTKDASYVSITYDMIEFSDISAEVNKMMVVTQPRLSAGPLGDRTNNYSLVGYNARGTIYQKDISGTFYAANKIYDGSNNSIFDPTTIELFGIYSFDISSVGIIVNSVHFETPNAGEDKIVTGEFPDIYLIGSKSHNYNLESFLGTATIFPRQIQVFYDALDKYFDKTDIADVSGVSYNGVLETDVSDVFVDISMAFFEDALIGNNKNVYIESLDISGVKSINYEMIPIQNVTASILRPVTFIEPTISYEEIYFGMNYNRKFTAIGNTPFVYDISNGRLPNGLVLIGNEISGNVIEAGVFNFVVSASIPNIFRDRKLYTLRVRPLVTIREQKIFPLNTIDLPSGSSFNFLDPQLKNHIQETTLIYSDDFISFGNSIFDIGIQFSVEKVTNYRYVFSVIENPKNLFENVDYMFIFKIFDQNGNLISKLPTPLPLNIYLDNAQRKHIELYVASNPQTTAGNGDYTQRLGSKYKFECNIQRGDGAILVYLSNSSTDRLDSTLITIFDHLEQVDRFLLADYMTTPQLYVENNFNEKMDEWKMFVESKFPDRIGNKKLSEL